MNRIIAAFFLFISPALAGPVGIFEANQDIGTLLHPGSVEFDAAKKNYTIAGSGENMWAAKDAFQFAWKNRGNMCACIWPAMMERSNFPGRPRASHLKSHFMSAWESALTTRTWLKRRPSQTLIFSLPTQHASRDFSAPWRRRCWPRAIV